MSEIDDLTPWPTAKLIPSKDNSRDAIGDVSVLAASIKELGMLQPIVACTLPDTGETGHLLVVAGHRRLAAAQKLGLRHVPVIVKDIGDDGRRLAINLAENVHREDLNPLERARALQRIAALGKTQREIADLVGLSQPAISKSLAVLKLPEKAQQWVAAGEIPVDEAAALASLPEDRLKVLAGRPRPPSKWQIEQAVDTARRHKEAGKKLDALEQAGARVIRKEAPSWTSSSHPKVAEQHWITTRMTMAAHRKLECHAYMLPPYGADPAEVCTKPSNHEEPAPPKLHTYERRARAEEIAAQLRPYLAHRLQHDSVARYADFAAAWALDTMEQRGGLEAMILLGMPVEEGMTEWDASDAIRRAVGAGEINAAKALYAYALGDGLDEVIYSLASRITPGALPFLSWIAEDPDFVTQFGDVVELHELVELAKGGDNNEGNEDDEEGDDLDVGHTESEAAQQETEGPQGATAADVPSGLVMTIMTIPDSPASPGAPYAVVCPEHGLVARHRTEAAARERCVAHLRKDHLGVGTVELRHGKGEPTPSANGKSRVGEAADASDAHATAISHVDDVHDGAGMVSEGLPA